MGVLTWVVCIHLPTPQSGQTIEALLHHVSDISGILFFHRCHDHCQLIDIYGGFDLVMSKITTTHKRTLLIIVTIISFFLSAVLDNLTTAIIMSLLIVKLLPKKIDFADDRHDCHCIQCLVALGALSEMCTYNGTPWVGHQITAVGIMKALFLPSLSAASFLCY